MNKPGRIISSIIIVLMLFIPDFGYCMLRIVPSTFNLGEVKAEDYQKGYIEKFQGNIIILMYTGDWKLTVKTNNPNMGVIGDYAKAINDFQWKATGSDSTQTNYISIENHDVEVAKGGITPGATIIMIDYKVLLGWKKDIPGNYNIELVYTLTSQ